MTPEQANIVNRDYADKGPTALGEELGLSRDVVANYAYRNGLRFTGERHHKRGTWAQLSPEEIRAGAEAIKRENRARGDAR